jgi:hypothetical protein
MKSWAAFIEWARHKTLLFLPPAPPTHHATKSCFVAPRPPSGALAHLVELMKRKLPSKLGLHSIRPSRSRRRALARCA